MTKLLLSLHVIAAIIAIGPVTVAASMFPPAVRRASAAPGDRDAWANVTVLHRICRVYAVAGVAVPVFGLATAKNMGVLGDTWLIVSMALTLVAAVVLGALVLPRQSALLEMATPAGSLAPAASGGSVPPAAGDENPIAVPRSATAQLAMFTGIFNLLWAVVTILMIIRPGSTTGA
ncbi:hypothetical protein AB0P17_25975 [Streptomyces sp. NPDC088124]|uniref:hypothetical protein n=1 Tax=Streptomyces sp. NPDC088124 TaxID=3154654 RepID=UPI003435476B